MLGLNEYGPDDWQPPVLQTCATDGIGVDDVVDTVDRFRARGGEVAGRRRRARVCGRIRQLASDGFLEHAEHTVLEPGAFDRLVDQVAGAELDPYTAAQAVIDQALRSPRAADHRDDAVPLRGVLDHIGIAVRDLDTALVFYRDALGLELEGAVEEVASQHVRAQFVSAGPATLELLEATSPQSAIARSIERRGPGLHHLTLRVDDIAGVLARLKARGVRLIDEVARTGAGGHLIAFIHPSASHGVLVELMESSASGDSTGRDA